MTHPESDIIVKLLLTFPNKGRQQRDQLNVNMDFLLELTSYSSGDETKLVSV
jgi:hypothetical protein